MLRGYLGDITSLKVRKATRDRLAKVGNKAETFDDVINRLLDFYQRSHSAKSRRVR
jgi:hypothetical protein